MARHCSCCGQVGHYAKKCPSKANNQTETQKQEVLEIRQIEPDNAEQKETPEEIPEHHRIYLESKEKQPRIPINGVKPKAGLFIVNKETKVIAGRIVMVKSNGNILWVGENNLEVETEQWKIKESGYEYVFVIPDEKEYKQLSYMD